MHERVAPSRAPWTGWYNHTGYRRQEGCFTILTDQVRRTNEKDLGHVHGHVQVVVDERLVLVRVQELEEGGSRVPPVPTQLVHLIDQHQGVGRLHRLETLMGRDGEQCTCREGGRGPWREAFSESDDGIREGGKEGRTEGRAGEGKG